MTLIFTICSRRRIAIISDQSYSSGIYISCILSVCTHAYVVGCVISPQPGPLTLPPSCVWMSFQLAFLPLILRGYEWKSDTYVLRSSSPHMHPFVGIIPHRIITILLYGVLLKDNICSDPYMEVGYHLLQRAANCLVCSSCISQVIPNRCFNIHLFT